MPALAFCFALSDAFVFKDHTLEIECPALHSDISGMSLTLYTTQLVHSQRPLG